MTARNTLVSGIIGSRGCLQQTAAKLQKCCEPKDLLCSAVEIADIPRIRTLTIAEIIRRHIASLGTENARFAIDAGKESVVLSTIYDMCGYRYETKKKGEDNGDCI